jgi:hypothetical protein
VTVAVTVINNKSLKFVSSRILPHRLHVSKYLRKKFPGIKVNPSSTIMLKGIGNNQTHGWVNADILFVNNDKAYTSVTGAFHVVTSLATKIVVGNDILAEEGAIIDLKQGPVPSSLLEEQCLS